MNDRCDPLVPELAEHTPLRPLWICRIDARPWPCPDARLNLITTYLPHRRIELYLYLGLQFTTALVELDTIVVETGVRATPTSLHLRILGWLIAHEARGRAKRRGSA